MKKIIHLLMAALPLLGMTACSDDDKDLPAVDINIEYAGAKRSTAPSTPWPANRSRSHQ